MKKIENMLNFVVEIALKIWFNKNYLSVQTEKGIKKRFLEKL